MAAVLCCLLLAGCAGQEAVRQSGAEEQSDAAVRLPENGGMSGEEAVRQSGEAACALNVMQLFSTEDTGNGDAAALLLKNGAGAMVRITAGSLSGSGVIYREEAGELLILTAAHVVEQADREIFITFSDGLQLAVSDCEIFSAADLALVRVGMAELPEENRENYCLVNTDKEAFDGVRAGDGCIVMGCRTGIAGECCEGEILEPWIYMADYAQYMMWVSAEGKPGMSGGGLFDMQGHFLGILSGMDEEGELAVVPLSLILAQIG